MIRKMSFLVGVILFFVGVNAIAAEAVGTIIASRGKVYVAGNNGAVKRSLHRKSKIYLKEMVVTNKDSAVQLRLRDDTIISLRPNTKYAVNEFVFDKKEPENNRYLGELIEGVLVSLSGQGKNSEYDNHLLKTPVVTIAIRGTFYEAGIKIKDFKKSKFAKRDNNVEETDSNKKLDLKKSNDIEEADSNKKLDLKKSNDIEEADSNDNTVSIGWIQVADGELNVSAGDNSFSLYSEDKNSNACVYKAVGNLDDEKEFVLNKEMKINVKIMGAAEMRKLVATNLEMLKVIPFFRKYITKGYFDFLKTFIPIPGIDNAIKNATKLVNDFSF